jgi:hypothetical protein
VRHNAPLNRGVLTKSHPEAIVALRKVRWRQIRVDRLGWNCRIISPYNDSVADLEGHKVLANLQVPITRLPGLGHHFVESGRRDAIACELDDVRQGRKLGLVSASTRGARSRR